MIVVYPFNVPDITETHLGETIKSIPEPIKETISQPIKGLSRKGK